MKKWVYYNNKEEYGRSPVKKEDGGKKKLNFQNSKNINLI